ncbi:hypothetical protein [Flavobacterium psychrotrophum]|uniref:hypothetical protein n=1 Tax=Flavobacterium psychrotrophum TaxID=2294119 RepID=UPI0013C506A6|nr:hypothetical protein [Flavobacterium psychrotrophum]
MSKITHSKEFADFVKNGVDQKYHIGTGNPYAKILFVGKESAINKNEIDRMQKYSENAREWSEYVQNSGCQRLNYPVHKKDGKLFFEDHDLRKGWGRNTWSKYQKLTDLIFRKNEKPFYVDFLENVFTTEINDSPEKNTASADKSSLSSRKELFRASKFIQDFPVVVLACSNYFKNNDNLREIDKTFSVEYFDGEGKKYTPSNWFYTHYSTDENRSRLVIHTRQLSANVKPELLGDMANIIRQHLIRTRNIEV